MTRPDTRDGQAGIALISALMVTMLLSALLVGFVSIVISDQQSGRLNRDQTQAYGAAHAGVEKLTAALGGLFIGGNYNPQPTQIQALYADATKPQIEGFEYVSSGGINGYRIAPPGARETRTIPDGPYEGLVGLITPYTIEVTARGPGGAEVSMRRELQTVAVPVFQFGIFSDGDLSFFAGPSFQFGGRVHTNQNLYLAQDGSDTLTLQDKVTAVGEIVRTHLSNGEQGTHPGTVRVARAEGCLPPPQSLNEHKCLELAPENDSVDLSANVNNAIPPSVLVNEPGGPGEPDRLVMRLRTGNTPRAGWFNLSTGSGDNQFNGYIRNGQSGARRLELPIVDASAGTEPIDLIRRPRALDSTAPGSPYQERFFRLGSIRILLSDDPDEITNLPLIDNLKPPVKLDALEPGVAPTDHVTYLASNPPIAKTGSGSNYLAPANTPSVTGYIKIERQRADGTFTDVTMEILNLGISARNIANGDLNSPDTAHCVNHERNPDAVIRLQRVYDHPSSYTAGATARQNRCGKINSTTWTAVPTDYIPLALYDAREGTRREGARPGTPYLGGVMHYVELDVDNLRKWFAGQIGTTGDDGTMNDTGYVVYFSDRRNNRTERAASTAADNALDGIETGELGFEDFVNRHTSDGAPDGGNPGPGEDLNGDGQLQVYGNRPLYRGRLIPALSNPVIPQDWPTLRGAHLGTQLAAAQAAAQARVNPVVFFRRALKIVNAGLGQLPAVGRKGLTIASENPVYVEGNFNACGGSRASCTSGGFDGVDGVALGAHVSAAIIADSVTLLSRDWNDINTFNSPHDFGGRVATTTWYRLGIIAGKGLSFRRPTSEVGADGVPEDFGTDGGAHNFLRFLENWGGRPAYYRGSIVSLFTNRQGVGTFKCCRAAVYSPPNRQFKFEEEFRDPELLPPRTPMFRDVNTLGFRQVFRPTQ